MGIRFNAPHWDVLGERQLGVLRRLGPAMSELNLYLAGGTALALQLGHRHSIDFDWFSQHQLDPNALVRSLNQRAIRLTDSRMSEGTLHARASQVRVSALEYRYRLLDPLISLELKAAHVLMAAPTDIAAMKLAAVTQRGAKKDFIDVFALARSGVQLSDMLTAYRRKYDVDDVGHVVYALSYFGDADHEDTPRMLWDVNWRTVKREIERWVRELD
jgi:predicted nucleotidyltransferase component of viral defense system